MKKTLLLSASLFISLTMFAQNETKAKAELITKTTAPVSITPMVSAQVLSAGKAVTAQPATAVLSSADVLANDLTAKQTEYNFGKIPQGKPVTHDFVVTNDSKVSFKLDNVQASCGCTTPEWNKEEMINPGKDAIIKVGYNAAAPGPFNKTITITYNGNQTKQIFIKGEVWNTPAASAPENTNLKDLN